MNTIPQDPQRNYYICFRVSFEDQLMKQWFWRNTLVFCHETEWLAAARDKKPHRNCNEALRQLKEVLLISSRVPLKSIRKFYLQVFENEEDISSLQDLLNDLCLAGEAYGECRFLIGLPKPYFQESQCEFWTIHSTNWTGEIHTSYEILESPVSIHQWFSKFFGRSRLLVYHQVDSQR